MLLEDFVEFRFLVGLEDDFFGAEAVFAGVLAGGGFAFLGARAGGVLGVGLVGFAAGVTVSMFSMVGAPLLGVLCPGMKIAGGFWELTEQGL